jgi:hypothetical protein
MRVRFAAIAGMLLGVGIASPALAAITWPGYGNDTLGPTTIITINSNLTVTVGAGPSSQGPYDGSEDTYIGVVNNSSQTVNSLGLSAPHANDIFGFDGDGIDTFGAPSNSSDTSDGGYGGPQGYFTNIVLGTPNDTGTVNFVGGIAAGGYTYFSLEGNLTSSSFSGGTVTTSSVPEPASLVAWSMLGALGLAWQWRRSRKAA